MNGEAIYGTRPFAPYRDGQWAFTQKGQSRYITYLPAKEEMALPAALPLPVVAPFKTATLLATGAKLKVKSGALQIPVTQVNQTQGQSAWVFKLN